MDFRLKENRKEAFINWFADSLKINDCDPAIYMTNYFFDRFEYNIEQRFWLCWIYGTTYYWPTTYVIWNEFPDMHLVGLKRLEKWNTENYHRLRYQTDTKWNKGHLPAQFESYKKWVGDKKQLDAFSELLCDDPTENFNILWEEINKKFHKFGRYSSWFYLQTLKFCCRLNINAPSLMLEDYSGSRSHRNGLCYALGMDEWVDVKLEPYQIEQLNQGAKEIISEVNERYPSLNAEYFGMETCLCSFKKLFRKSRGRYLGYYLDRQAEEIIKVEQDGWDGIDWKPMWDARTETIQNEYLTSYINHDKMHLFLDTGHYKPENVTLF